MESKYELALADFQISKSSFLTDSHFMITNATEIEMDILKVLVVDTIRCH